MARSVVAAKAETVIVAVPGRLDLRRATTLAGSHLPIYGASRGAQCDGRWLHVGLESWVCSDHVELSTDPPDDDAPIASDGLPYRYYFVAKNGANGYESLDRAGDDAPDEQLDPGFAVATTEERTKGGERFVKTRHGTWIDTGELGAARPSGFHGEDVGPDGLNFAWIARPTGTHVRREVVRVLEEKSPRVRIGEREWIDARALVRPTLAAPPPEVRGEREHWIDVELARQTLVAYEGARPVFATLVSTGAGAPGTDTATRKGTFRIWVKLLSSTMDNIGPLRAEDAHPAAEGARYSMEDVPYVQFFDKAIALHGVFWHDDFGHPHSHGCVNLAPRDAARLFAFTGPRLTPGLAAILPSHAEPGTVVRVR
ncbi:MAG TPA: L,D-transpeptidase [Polyangiaceae bacterium]